MGDSIKYNYARDGPSPRHPACLYIANHSTIVSFTFIRFISHDLCIIPWLCEIKLLRDNFEIISVFYFTCNHVWNWNRIISATERVLELFQNYFTDNERAGIRV